MSTEFLSDTTEELAFVRFAGGPVAPSFEFGTVTNFEQVCAALDQGDTFSALGDVGCGGTPGTFTNRAELERLCADGRVTFGQFPFTVALGSGDLFRFSVEL